MKQERRRRLWRFGQAVLTVTATYFLFRSLRVSWGELETVSLAAWRPHPLMLLVSVVALLGTFVYSVGLWARMIRVLDGPRVGLWLALKLFFVSNLGRYIPGKLWQIASLAYLARAEGISPALASSAAVLSQLFNLGAAALVGGLSLYFGVGPRIPEPVLVGAVGLLALVAAIALIPSITRRLLTLALRLARDDGVVPPLDRWFGVRWVAFYLPAWAGYGLAFGLLWSAFPGLPDVSWPVAVATFAGAYFLGYAVLFAPAGVGVREGVMALMLAPWLGAAQAAILAIIARIWMTLVELLPILGVAGRGGGRWLRRRLGAGAHVV